ncbi:MAG TPA: DNA polymerase III subunit epsilon [Rickettsia endosymbiont of Omalisus fontisbellaquei]|nr:DNA polymerase III subunit epsilon [Rickettsia endosymbiont of Omalisus fontisbellaquei]
MQQLTLFDNENPECSWESVNSNREKHQIINCDTSSEITNNLKRVIETRKNQDYNTTPALSSNTTPKIKMYDTNIHNIELFSSILENPQHYRIIQEYQKQDFYKINDSVPKQIGVFLDTETTGLSNIDKILELGMVKFEYCENGYVYKVLEEFNQYQDPSEPIAEHITKLTGITDEMVKGRNIDKNLVAKFLEDVDIIIAHNAAFDRPFFEKMFPALPPKAWGCSRADIDWKAESIESQKLEYLAYKYNFFYEGHRAVIDCLAGLHILAQNLPISKEPVLKQLLTNCHKTSYKIWAKNAPFETKDLLKTRGYRWSIHPQENYKAWMIKINEDNLEHELNFLNSSIYPTPFNIPVETITPFNRFT